MAVKLERTTNANERLSLISVLDDAIDWDQTYPDELSVHRKQSRYEQSREIKDLVFKEDVQPTIFVFDHPNRLDVRRKIRSAFARQAKAADQSDLFTEVWEKAFVGTQEGLDSKEIEPAPRRNGQITDAYYQALEDADVFVELATVFVREFGKSADAERDAVKKK
jgi:hypothetical protein